MPPGKAEIEPIQQKNENATPNFFLLTNQLNQGTSAREKCPISRIETPRQCLL
jgi:hypothetical protein